MGQLRKVTGSHYVLKRITNALKSLSASKVTHSVNLHNVGWHISAEGSDLQAIQGAELVLECLRPHYEAVLVIYPVEIDGFKGMLASVATPQKPQPLEACSGDAFAAASLENSQAIFTLSYSLKSLFHNCHEQDERSVFAWIEGMRDLMSSVSINCCVVIVGENPLGVDFQSKCRALGVGRVLISDVDTTAYEVSALPHYNRLPRNPASQGSLNPFDRAFSVSEIQQGHIPPLIRFRDESPLSDMAVAKH